MHEPIALAPQEVLDRDARRACDDARDVGGRHAVVEHRERTIVLGPVGALGGELAREVRDG